MATNDNSCMHTPWLFSLTCCLNRDNLTHVPGKHQAGLIFSAGERQDV